MPQYPFGSGALWLERTDTTGDNIGPVQIGVLQENTITADATIRDLRGQMTFPDDIAISERRLTVTSRHGRIFGAIWSDIVFGQTLGTTANTASVDEAGTIPGSVSYVVTVTNSSVFALDLGVTRTSTGVRFNRVASVAASGQYSVSAGVYTFHSSDAGVAVKISYLYTLTAKKTTIVNEFQGVLPVFKATFYSRRSGTNTNSMVWTLNACVCSKLTIPARMGEYTVPSLDFEAFADNSGVVGTISTTE